MELKDYLKDWQSVKIKGSERNDLFRQIYAFYDTVQEDNHRRKANFERYKKYLKENKIKHSNEVALKFKKHKTFLKKITPKDIATFWLSYVKTPDLFYVLSVCKDKSFRNESVGGYICGLSTVKDLQKK